MVALTFPDVLAFFRGKVLRGFLGDATALVILWNERYAVPAEKRRRDEADLEEGLAALKIRVVRHCALDRLPRE
jgi:hypothetical protein